jgi:hypothetical protein
MGILNHRIGMMVVWVKAFPQRDSNHYNKLQYLRIELPSCK